MPNIKPIYSEECTCGIEQYTDGTKPLYFDHEDDAIKQLIWFFNNYNYYKKYDKWLYEERLYWGVHHGGKHMVTLRAT